tara:strand:- start:124 stop:342 length:219 start_codon:yes stop_codon:yes gene_type:complete
MTDLNVDHESLMRIYERNEQTGGLASNMTLRDKFAGQAMAYFSDLDFINNKVCANWCYDMADAMLEARKVTK